MGNICGKESDAFAQPGRRLDEAPSTPASVAVPASATSKPGATTSSSSRVGGPPRRLGGESSKANNSSSAASTSTPASAEDARRKAAAAAEARAQGSKGGDLSKKLAEQKKLTHRATLELASQKNLRERELDANVSALQHK